MTLKKKLVVSTLAASMVAASVAGLPLGSLGAVGTASAATVSSSAAVKDKVLAVYKQLTATDAVYLYNLKTEVAALSEKEFTEIFAPVLNKLSLDGEETKTSLKLFQSVTSVVYDVYGNDFSGIQVVRNDDKNIALVSKIAAKAGVSGLTVDSVAEFLSSIETELRDLVGNKSSADLLAILTSESGYEILLDEAIAKVMNHTTGAGALTVSQALNKLGVTANDVKQTLKNLNNNIKSAKPAAKSLAVAYVKAYGFSTGGGVGPGSGGSGSGNGSVTTPVAPVQTPGIYDVSKLVSIVDGKATLKLIDADVIKEFDKLVAANPGKTGLTLTLNLGTVNATTVEVPLSQAIIEAAKAKGIANIAVTFNGVTVTIPVSQFSTAISLTVTTAKPEVVTSVTKLKLASDVYEFTLSVNGVAQSTFKQPITIKLPLKNTDGLDKELLSVGKLVYGDLQFQGGVLDGDFIVEPRDTFSSYAVLENKVSFNDIAAVQAWAGRQIQVVAAKGAIEGVGAGKFAPKSNVTRAEFSKMLIRALNLENNSAVQSFSDVSSTAWYAPYVAVAAEKGIITGRSAAKFDPNATITRAEMATMISRALKSINPDAKTDSTAISKFSDAAKISASLRDGVAFAASHNLVIGNAGKFNPNDTATRAEAAVIIYRTINFK
ncbi:S-layer homology domain-containing protein [Paenibacillus odorifer]|uniref:S-layer homology domain-containing protein n=1 Tax=Paenibacillus odorifer TaxID=189426 RepID=UPI002DB6CF9A|nr:S-layer homology domain-containing protein [Paenibacillus odorifer]MEC0132128.1 S-layer homology domain-containing protein [Paenibacillus odorifer]MEC0220200.1 S-layer homology domain-containing protein [Paenibacillus odorifer]